MSHGVQCRWPMSGNTRVAQSWQRPSARRQAGKGSSCVSRVQGPVCAMSSLEISPGQRPRYGFVNSHRWRCGAEEYRCPAVEGIAKPCMQGRNGRLPSRRHQVPSELTVRTTKSDSRQSGLQRWLDGPFKVQQGQSPVILEPVMKVEGGDAGSYMGDVMGRAVAACLLRG